MLVRPSAAASPIAAASIFFPTTDLPGSPFFAARCLSTLRVLLRLLEIIEFRGRLVLARRHQLAIRAQHIDLVADRDVRIVLGADRLAPPIRFLRLGIAA